MVRQADDPFVCFGVKPDKGFGLEISTWPEVGRECQSESWTKELEEGSWRWMTDRAVDTGQQRDELAWERVQSSEEDRSG